MTVGRRERMFLERPTMHDAKNLAHGVGEQSDPFTDVASFWV